MKEEWLFPGAMVPVDAETTTALVAEIKRLIDVVGGMALKQGAEQAQDESLELFEYWNAVEGWVKIEEVRKHFGSVGCGTIYKNAGEDRVPVYTAPPKRPWVELTAPEIVKIVNAHDGLPLNLAFAIEAKLKEKNT